MGAPGSPVPVAVPPPEYPPAPPPEPPGRPALGLGDSEPPPQPPGEVFPNALDELPSAPRVLLPVAPPPPPITIG